MRCNRRCRAGPLVNCAPLPSAWQLKWQSRVAVCVLLWQLADSCRVSRSSKLHFSPRIRLLFFLSNQKGRIFFLSSVFQFPCGRLSGARFAGEEGEIRLVVFVCRESGRRSGGPTYRKSQQYCREKNLKARREGENATDMYNRKRSGNVNWKMQLHQTRSVVTGVRHTYRG